MQPAHAVRLQQDTCDFLKWEFVSKLPTMCVLLYKSLKCESNMFTALVKQCTGLVSQPAPGIRQRRAWILSHLMSDNGCVIITLHASGKSFTATHYMLLACTYTAFIFNPLLIAYTLQILCHVASGYLENSVQWKNSQYSSNP